MSAGRRVPARLTGGCCLSGRRSRSFSVLFSHPSGLCGLCEGPSTGLQAASISYIPANCNHSTHLLVLCPCSASLWGESGGETCFTHGCFLGSGLLGWAVGPGISIAVGVKVQQVTQHGHPLSFLWDRTLAGAQKQASYSTAGAGQAVKGHVASHVASLWPLGLGWQ